MKICIIGCGYVGKNLAQKWKSEGHEVTVTTRSLERSYQLRPFADLVYILNDNWHDLLEKQDIVLLSVAPDKGASYIETYLRTAETLSIFLKNSSVSQVIYTSSTSVYGDHEGHIVDEMTLPKPNYNNAHILLGTEEILLKENSNKRRVCIFRLGEIYGPERSIVKRLEGIQGTQLSGNGASMTNLIHIEEINLAIDLAVKRRVEGIYNLCNDIHIPRKDLYHQICEENGWQDVIWNTNLINSHSGNKIVSNQKLKGTGWLPLNISPYISI